MKEDDNNLKTWSKFAKVYDPIKCASIDGTDTEPHDRAVVRALNAEYCPNRFVKGHPERTLFVSRLSHETSKDTIKDVFSKYGKLKRFRLVKDIVTGMPKGYAFVEYEEEQAAEEAYQLANKMVIDGHTIFVDFECERLLKGWIPRRLGGGFGGTKESGQLRFGGRDRPFKKPIALELKEEEQRRAKLKEKRHRRRSPVSTRRSPGRRKHSRSKERMKSSTNEDIPSEFYEVIEEDNRRKDFSRGFKHKNHDDSARCGDRRRPRSPPPETSNRRSSIQKRKNSRSPLGRRIRNNSAKSRRSRSFNRKVDGSSRRRSSAHRHSTSQSSDSRHFDNERGRKPNVGRHTSNERRKNGRVRPPSPPPEQSFNSTHQNYEIENYNGSNQSGKTTFQMPQENLSYSEYTRQFDNSYLSYNNVEGDGYAAERVSSHETYNGSQQTTDLNYSEANLMEMRPNFGHQEEEESYLTSRALEEQYFAHNGSKSEQSTSSPLYENNPSDLYYKNGNDFQRKHKYKT